MKTNILKVSDYFDDLVAYLDLQAELYVKNNIHCQHLVDEANAARLVYIAEIRACEAYNISLLRENNDHKLDESQQQNRTQPTVVASTELLFKKFCFIIQLYKSSVEDEHFSWRLFSTDRFLSPGEINSFQEILKFTIEQNKANCYLNLAKCSLERLFTDVEINPHVIKFNK
jgi:hypothetical protein